MLMSSEAVKAQSSFATTIIRAIREIMQNACPFTRQGARQARGLADEGMQMITRLEGWTTLLFFFLFVRWTHVKMYDARCVCACVCVCVHARWYCDLKRLGAPWLSKRIGVAPLWRNLCRGKCGDESVSYESVLQGDAEYRNSSFTYSLILKRLRGVLDIL